MMLCNKCGYVWEAVEARYCPMCLRNWGEYVVGHAIQRV